MEKPVMIFGYGPLTHACIEIFKSHNIEVYGVLDDEPSSLGKEMGEITVLGNTSDQGFLKYIGKKCESFIASDDNALRKKLVKMLNENRHVMPVNAVHAKAYVSTTAFFGHGNFINMGVTVGAACELGSHILLHSHSTVDHGVKIGDFAQIGAGSVIGSGVEIAQGAFIGTGAVIVPGIKIGKNARVGAGSVVISNVGDNETVFGNPAKKVER